MNEDSMTDAVLDPDDALARLMEGNARFLRGKSRFSRSRKDVLISLTSGQRPYVTILGCSDSRAPPELLFDAGFGSLFVIRVAGNVLSPEVFGSIQYGAMHLGTQLFMVLGHEDCGAVKAALAAKFEDVKERARIQNLLQVLLPGLDDIDPAGPDKFRLERAIEANVRWSMQQILKTPEGIERTAEGKMKLVGAICDIATGRVRLLP